MSDPSAHPEPVEGPATITPNQARMLTAVLAGVEQGLGGAETARDAGVSFHKLAHALSMVFGSGRWPTDVRPLRAALALPRAIAPQGRDYDPVVLSPLGAAEREAAEIERRGDAVKAARIAHERHWLAEERRRHGPLPRSRPLSQQLA